MPIFNPIAFIGEYILGASSGVPLVADSNGQLAQGLSVIEVGSSSDATTTSGTPSLLTTMTTTPTPGNYLAWFSCSSVSNGTNCTVTYGLYVGGTLQTETSRTSQPYDGGTLAAGTATAGVAINKLITVTTGQAVEIHWSTSGGTATCHQRVLNLLRVS